MTPFSAAPATWLLVAANVLVFLAEERAGGSLRPEVALRFGAQTLPLLRRGQLHRLVSSMFVHFGLFHLLCNMYSLYNLGPPLEAIFGTARYLALYLVSGLCGNLLTWAHDIRSPRPAVSAGASGAVFGLLGAWLALALHPQTRPFVDVSSLAAILVLNAAYGFSAKTVNMAAHLGGLAAGTLVAAFFLAPF